MKRSSRRGRIKSPELPIYQKKSPLVLFQPDENEKCKQTFSVTTQTLFLIVDKICQTESEIEIRATKFTQTDKDDSEIVRRDMTRQTLATLMHYPNFLSSIVRLQFPMTKMYQPANVFSPMATLLTPMGN